MVGVACRDCSVHVVGKRLKIGMGVCGVIRSYLVWLLFGDSIPICLFYCFCVTCFSSFCFWGGGGGGI